MGISLKIPRLMTSEVVTSHSPFVVFRPLDLERKLIIEVVYKQVEEFQHFGTCVDLDEARFQVA